MNAFDATDTPDPLDPIDATTARERAACRLTVPMRLLHGHPAPEHVYLAFRRTGLLVELLDIPVPAPEEEQAAVTLALRDVDALGLGLRADDFADGVAVCHDGAVAGAGWRCEPVVLAGVDATGRVDLLLDEADAARWLG